MSKKDLIKKMKNGYGWINKHEIWYGRYIKRYLQKRTCKMTSQKKQEIKQESEYPEIIIELED